MRTSALATPYVNHLNGHLVVTSRLRELTYASVHMKPRVIVLRTLFLQLLLHPHLLLHSIKRVPSSPPTRSHPSINSDVERGPAPWYADVATRHSHSCGRHWPTQEHPADGLRRPNTAFVYVNTAASSPSMTTRARPSTRATSERSRQAAEEGRGGFFGVRVTGMSAVRERGRRGETASEGGRQREGGGQAKWAKVDCRSLTDSHNMREKAESQNGRAGAVIRPSKCAQVKPESGPFLYP
jgi:hypothetical protein